MSLRLVGSFVFLLDGATPTRPLQLADEAWKSLDTETESTVILFDPAKGPVSCLSVADNGRPRLSPGLRALAFLSAPGRKIQRPFLEPAKPLRKSFR